VASLGGSVASPGDSFVLRNDPFVLPNGPLVPPNDPFVLQNGPFVPQDDPFAPPNHPFVLPNGPLAPPNDPFVPPNDPFVLPDDPATGQNWQYCPLGRFKGSGSTSGHAHLTVISTLPLLHGRQRLCRRNKLILFTQMAAKSVQLREKQMSINARSNEEFASISEGSAREVNSPQERLPFPALFQGMVIVAVDGERSSLGMQTLAPFARVYRHGEFPSEVLSVGYDVPKIPSLLCFNIPSEVKWVPPDRDEARVCGPLLGPLFRAPRSSHTDSKPTRRERRWHRPAR
jgi:hypothetical protein